MNHIKYIISIITLLTFVAISSCGGKHAEGDGHDHETKETTHAHGDDLENKSEVSKQSEDDGHDQSGEEDHKEGLYLTKEQTETIGLEFGTLSAIKINDFIKATGSLGLPPNAQSSVSAKTNGIIIGTKKFVEGEYIKKGTAIAYLENADIIVTQQEYLEAKAQLNFKRLEVERQQTLIESNAGVVKNLQNAQAEVAILEAKTQGLSKQLSFLGISTSNLSPNTIRQQITIVAPMSGFISKINFHNGMYAQSSISLMDIISSEHLHLELDVFEKDIAHIKKSQIINYTIPALGNTIYTGKVEEISKEFDGANKTLRVHGHIVGKSPTFIKDLFIDAKIFLNDIQTDALPESAIIKDGEKNFIYVARNEKDAQEVEFKTVNVITGTTDNGYTAVKLMEEIPKGMHIVTKGAFYVYAQSKSGELSHEH